MDDCLQAGDKAFRRLTEKTERRLDCRPRIWGNLEYVVMEADTAEKRKDSPEKVY